MALTYSLKYKKLNPLNKILLEKEGEIVIDRQNFRLKGKGAQDMGEVIYFGDMKDLHIKGEELSFTTYTKDRYVLSDFLNLFDDFLRDFVRVRNEYLADALFMKVGMLIKEFDCTVEIVNNYGKINPKGRGKIQLYEGSIVFMPETRECFAVYLNFLKGHEFDDEEFILHLYLDNGNVINVSHLGSYFEDTQEAMETVMGKMYERVLKSLGLFFPELDAQTLIKLAYKVKEGRFVSMKEFKKIDKELPEKVFTALYGEKEDMKSKIEMLKALGGEDNFLVSLSFGKDRESGDPFLRTWFLQGLPAQNLVCIGRTSGANDNIIHFFRIIMQNGDPAEKMPAKILEIEQSLVLFKFDFSPVYKDRKELRKSKYRTVLKKLSFLRLLRKSYLGYNHQNFDTFKTDLEDYFERAKPVVLQKPGEGEK
ncbi:hypothetical protein GF340_02985 [Candidatus Peregrinibacteria bacterium]|nr:hypothetical protein [Candidatus Peregrinibacteria bacterium]